MVKNLKQPVYKSNVKNVEKMHIKIQNLKIHIQLLIYVKHVVELYLQREKLIVDYIREILFIIPLVKNVDQKLYQIIKN